MEIQFCTYLWPIYLCYFVYLNYKWLMAAGHNFGSKNTTNAATADVLFTAVLIVISFSLCQLQLSGFSAGVMAFHLLVSAIRPGWISSWIHINHNGGK
jgi:hypothetical protein